LTTRNKDFEDILAATGLPDPRIGMAIVINWKMSQQTAISGMRMLEHSYALGAHREVNYAAEFFFVFGQQGKRRNSIGDR
jgi:hypothetical protein